MGVFSFFGSSETILLLSFLMAVVVVVVIGVVVVVMDFFNSIAFLLRVGQSVLTFEKSLACN